MTIKNKSIVFQFLYPIVMIGCILGMFYSKTSFIGGSIAIFLIAMIYIIIYHKVAGLPQGDEEEEAAAVLIFVVIMESITAHNIFSYVANTNRCNIPTWGDIVLLLILFGLIIFIFSYVRKYKKEEFGLRVSVTFDDLNIPVVYTLMCWFIIVAYVLNFGTWYVFVPVFWGLAVAYLSGIKDLENEHIFEQWATAIFFLVVSLCYQAYQHFF